MLSVRGSAHRVKGECRLQVPGTRAADGDESARHLTNVLQLATASKGL